MKKGAAKALISIFIILLFAGFVFYRGYVNTKVPAGEFGVLISSTSGVYPMIIENGTFCWRWEAVIPRNVKIYSFSKQSETISKTVKKELPSAAIYSSLLQGNPDFSYSFEYNITLEINPENLLKLVSEGNASGQEKLDEYLDEACDEISLDLSQYLVNSSRNEVVFKYDSQKLIEDCGIRNKFPAVTVKNIDVKKAQIPDMEMYELAKKSFRKFQDMVDAKLDEAAKLHAEKFIVDERAVKKLEKIAEVLKNNPELNSLLSNGNAAEVLKALNDLQ